jgi:hypothetical protein
MGSIPENQSCNPTAYLISLSFKHGKTNTFTESIRAKKRNCQIKNYYPKLEYSRIENLIDTVLIRNLNYLNI